MMIDFEKLFKGLSVHADDKQKRFDCNAPVAIYYGITLEGYYRLAFRSSVDVPKLESTKLIHVIQGKESSEVFWTCFDLINTEAKDAYFAFCRNMVETAQCVSTESAAIAALRKRYISWKTLFKNATADNYSKEKIQGLYGELLFLNRYMISAYGPDAVHAWGGTDITSKDFAIGTDWFEVKTVGATADIVKINSLVQLYSERPGRLVIVRVEHMPDEYKNTDSCIADLVSSILNLLGDEVLESVFMQKLTDRDINLSHPAFSMKFEVKSMNRYLVDDEFPKITPANVNYPEIVNAAYDISIASIARFMEE